MTYTLLYSPQARKDIEKLDPVVKKRIGKALERFQKQPLTYAKRLTSARIGNYRFRVGNYRIIFNLRKDIILILRMGHRREIYER